MTHPLHIIIQMESDIYASFLAIWKSLFDNKITASFRAVAAFWASLRKTAKIPSGKDDTVALNASRLRVEASKMRNR